VTAKSHWREGAIIWRLGWARFWPRWWLILVIIQIGVALVLLQNGADDRVLQAIRAPETAPNFAKVNTAAGHISHWGDEHWSLPLAALLWSAGAIFQRKRWRQLGWSCLWAFLLATAAVDTFRLTLGRARPCAGVADGFYGPHLKSDYQGFPSGHSTTAFATAVSLAAASPALRVPCTAYACAVGWSRMQLNRHHPLDVLTGAVLGSFVGICFGSGLPGGFWRLRRKPRRLADETPP
jgi:membrane-associated phospholipid phosphatase